MNEEDLKQYDKDAIEFAELAYQHKLQLELQEKEAAEQSVRYSQTVDNSIKRELQRQLDNLHEKQQNERDELQRRQIIDREIKSYIEDQERAKLPRESPKEDEKLITLIKEEMEQKLKCPITPEPLQEKERQENIKKLLDQVQERQERLKQEEARQKKLEEEHKKQAEQEQQKKPTLAQQAMKAFLQNSQSMGISQSQ